MISVRPIILKIYLTDLRQIFSTGRTMAIDDQSDISSSIPQETLPWQPFLSLDAGGQWRSRAG